MMPPKEGPSRWLYNVATDGERPYTPRTHTSPQEEAMDDDEEQVRDRAWLRLLIAHTPFRETDQSIRQWIAEAFRTIETMFYEHDELHAYYSECHQLEETIPGTWSDHWSSDDNGTVIPKVIHMATLQAHFMEDVF